MHASSCRPWRLLGLFPAAAVSAFMQWLLNNALKQLDPHKTRIVLVDLRERVLRAVAIQQP